METGMMSLEDRLYPLRRWYETAPAPVRSLAGRAYRALPTGWRRGSAYARFYEEAIASETWDETTRQRYQVEAIRASLQAAARAPFYARRFAERGLKPAAFESLEQLADYPMLTKAELQTEREAMVNPDLGPEARLLLTTGGSSGVPVGFYLQKGVSRPKEQAYLDAQWRRRGYEPGMPTAVLRGSEISAATDGGIAWHDHTRHWLMLSSSHLCAERLDDYLRTLNDFQPRHLHAYPSAALLLARLMQAAGKRWSLPLTSVLCGSEKLSVEDQAFLEQHFEAPVYHWYGHSERVVLAGQGQRSNHLYFWPAYGCVEFGPPDTEGRREVIGTSFHNHVMPLIRYRTGDYVQVPASAEAELPMLEVAAVTGREHEFLIGAHGRRISLTAINRHDEVFEGLLAVQFAQEKAGVVEFRYQPGPNWREERLPQLEAALRRRLGEDFELRLQARSALEKTAAGKHRWLITTLLKGAGA